MQEKHRKLMAIMDQQIENEYYGMNKKVQSLTKVRGVGVRLVEYFCSGECYRFEPRVIFFHRLVAVELYHISTKLRYRVNIMKISDRKYEQEY